MIVALLLAFGGVSETADPHPGAGDPAAGATPSRAPAPPDLPDVVIDLDEAVRLALAQGVDARSAVLAARTAESRLGRARSAGLPDLGLDASARLYANPDLPAAASLGLGSTTPLYAGGALAADRDGARETLQGSLSQLAQVRSDVRLGVTLLLLDLSEAEGQLGAAEARLRADDALRGHVDAYVKAGTRTRADLYQQEATVAEAQAAVVAARRSRELTRLDLVDLLQLDPARPWRFTPPTDVPATAGSAEDLVATALAGRATVAAARSAEATAAAEVRAAQAGGRPSVDLHLDASVGLAATGAPLSEQLADGAGASAAVTAAVPIFGRGVVRDDVEQAQIAEDESRLARAAAEHRVALDVFRAFAGHDAAVAGLAAAEARQKAAAAAADVVGQRYDAGAALIAEVTTARAGLADAESALVTARVEVLRARATLRWAVGAD